MMKSQKEIGQSIVLIVIVLVGLIAMAGLVVDGGNAYLNRRSAQTAADAAALAGAYEYCVNKNDPTNIIIEYVETQNNATYENWYLDTDTGNIVVDVSIEQNNFFAKILGLKTTTVNAAASASCFPPGAADSVMPIAWSCRAPLPGMDSDSEDCEWKAIPWKAMEQIIGPGSSYDPYSDLLDDGDGVTPGSYQDGSGSLMLYLVMDTISSSAEIPCIQTDPIYGDVDCDLDGDGKIDILGNGDRSWLILDGDANNAQLDNIIRGELTFRVSAPTWYPGRDGAITDVYKDAKAFVEGKPVLIPVFQQICAPTSNPITDDLCASVRQPGDGLVQISTAASGTYFRVTGFAEFYVTCVSDKLAHSCPGKDLAISYGIVTKSTPSIEGYFINGWASNDQTIGSGGGVDLGIYVLSLTE